MKNHEYQSFKHGLMYYAFGFSLSLISTLAAYFITKNSLITGGVFVAVLSVLAIFQLYVQVRYFLHLTDEPSPRFSAKAFLFMLLIVAIVVFGSLWIMYNLDYNMMPDDVDTYLLQEEGFIKE